MTSIIGFNQPLQHLDEFKSSRLHLAENKRPRSTGYSPFDPSFSQRAFLESRGYRKEFEVTILVPVNDQNTAKIVEADAVYKGQQAKPYGGSLAGWMEAHLTEPADITVRAAASINNIDLGRADVKGVYDGYRVSTSRPGNYEVNFDAYVRN